jgi:SEC-C motif domain protein
MRSRYAAFALGLSDYLWRTWHPRTRPESVTLDDAVWTGLEILDVVDGSERDKDGVVEFVAHFRQGRRRARLRERSRFERRAGRWLYLDGETRT